MLENGPMLENESRFSGWSGTRHSQNPFDGNTLDQARVLGELPVHRLEPVIETKERQ